MASSTISSGALVTLQELNPSSPYFKQGASLRATGNDPRLVTGLKPVIARIHNFNSGKRLQDYNVEAGIATLVDGNATLKIDTQHLHLNLRVGSLYQFIGELFFEPSNEAVLKARVGRNVDGMDLKLYHQSLQLLREFQAEQINGRTP